MNWFLIIWSFSGIIGWLFTYHSSRKHLYLSYGEDMKIEKNLLLVLLFPICIFGGLFSLIYWMVIFDDKKSWSLYFNIKRYERKRLLKEIRISIQRDISELI